MVLGTLPQNAPASGRFWRVRCLILKGQNGATLRDRTGDLLITKPYVSSPICNYFSHSWAILSTFDDSARLLRTVETHETGTSC
jgi:hypothetical protein